MNFNCPNCGVQREPSAASLLSHEMSCTHVMGVDFAADGGDTTVFGHWEGGIFHVDHVKRDQIKEALARMTTREYTKMLARELEARLIKRSAVRIFYNHEDVSDQILWPDGMVIEGTAVEVVEDPARLLDAGGSEP